MALPREHHNGLTNHFLITLILNWTTCAVSVTPQRHCQHLKTSRPLCYLGNNNKQRGSHVILKRSIFRRFCHRQFSDDVRWRWTHRCCHLAILTLVSPLHSQWHCYFLTMHMSASPTLSRLTRGPGPLTNVPSVSTTQQSTVGTLTAINSALICSWVGAYDALTKTYFDLKIF